MAKAKAKQPRLKVFGATMGFFDTVVAAPSQAEALKAWGVRQNLFAEGAAHIVVDDAAVRAALAHPGEPLRRPIGSHKPFGRDADAPTLPDAPKGRRTRPTAPDRSALDAAEAALQRIEQDREREEAGFAEAKRALDQRIADARQAYADRSKAAKAALAGARAAFRRAGGR